MTRHRDSGCKCRIRASHMIHSDVSFQRPHSAPASSSSSSAAPAAAAVLPAGARDAGAGAPFAPLSHSPSAHGTCPVTASVLSETQLDGPDHCLSACSEWHNKFRTCNPVRRTGQHRSGIQGRVLRAGGDKKVGAFFRRYIPFHLKNKKLKKRNDKNVAAFFRRSLLDTISPVKRYQ